MEESGDFFSVLQLSGPRNTEEGFNLRGVVSESLKDIQMGSSRCMTQVPSMRHGG